MTIGVYFGAFAPFHKGHLQVAYRASSENEHTYVIVDGFADDKGDKIGLNLSKRTGYVKRILGEEETITVLELDEGHDAPDDPTTWRIPEPPYGWAEWLQEIIELVHAQIPDPQSETFNWYVGETEYKEELDIRLQEYEKNFNVILADRTQFTISATKIRNNPKDYYHFILGGFKKHFTQKVAILGGPSTGKSTLVRRLATTLGSEYSTEYARDYEYENNIQDIDLVVEDYKNFILGQWKYNTDTANASRNGLVFLDTDAILTQAYAKMYLTEEENKELQPLFDAIIPQEQFDYILVTQPTGTFVYDGYRNMEWSNDGELFTNILINLLKEYGMWDKCVLLPPIDDTYSYYDRYQEAMERIEIKTGYVFPRLHKG